MFRQSRTGGHSPHLTGLIRQGIRRCVFAMFFLVLLPCCSVYAKSAKQYSPSQASAWIRQQAGKTVNYWNPPSDAQCTELVYYYYRHLDVNAPDTDAWQYSEIKPPSGWKKIRCYPGFVAQQGDVAVWTGGPYGHVALIVSAGADSFLSLDQNMNGRHFAAFYRHSYEKEGELTFWGVIRPGFRGGRKDGHAVSTGRKIRSCVYYYRGSRKNLIISDASVRLRKGKVRCTFTIWYKNKQLRKKNYTVRYSRSRTKVTCYITGKGKYRRCRGKITLPLN